MLSQFQGPNTDFKLFSVITLYVLNPWGGFWWGGVVVVNTSNPTKFDTCDQNHGLQIVCY